MTTLGLIVLLAGTVSGATINGALWKGICLCVADNSIYARDGPGEEHRVVTVLNENDCFVSKGGILHIFGATWYELQNVQNQAAWVNAYHLRVKSMADCAVTSSSGSSTPFSITGADPFSGGDPFRAGTCTEGGMLYRDGDHLQRGGVTCTCQGGVVNCPGGVVG
uniref:Uncharacterized protein LOC111105719 n=1 Tax=Crassostrea virginica TaxID=6565 RepID=A0A8B8AZP7_CRAVI|nr:uncharacterized protein LOC111105719 [Crassostrea virginica]